MLWDTSDDMAYQIFVITAGPHRASFNWLKCFVIVYPRGTRRRTMHDKILLLTHAVHTTSRLLCILYNAVP